MRPMAALDALALVPIFVALAPAAPPTSSSLSAMRSSTAADSSPPGVLIGMTRPSAMRCRPERPEGRDELRACQIRDHHRVGVAYADALARDGVAHELSDAGDESRDGRVGARRRVNVQH